MRKLLNFLMLAAVLMAFQTVAFSQAAQPTFTTLSAAVADARQTVFRLTSANGFTASNQTTGMDFGAFIDSELVRVVFVNTAANTITVQRGQSNTEATPHAKAAIVITGLYAEQQSPGYNGGIFVQQGLRGACTASSYPFLPLIQVNPTDSAGQAMYNCNNGSWQLQTLLDAANAPIVAQRACTPPGVQMLSLLTSFGNTTDPFVVGTSTTSVAGTTFYDTIYLPQTQVVTGLSVLNGLTASTDKVDMALYRADGTFLAKTLAGGTLATGTGRFQDINLTATFIATGPARYWVSWQGAGTTTTIDTLPLTPGSNVAGLGAWMGVLGSSLTGPFDVIWSSLATGGAGPNTPATSLPTGLIATTGPVICIF